MRLYALRASIKLFNVVAILYVLVELGDVILLTVFFCAPLLPKNPHISDYLIKNALKRKYGTDELTPLDDTQELEANASIYQRFVK